MVGTIALTALAVVYLVGVLLVGWNTRNMSMSRPKRAIWVLLWPLVWIVLRFCIVQ